MHVAVAAGGLVQAEECAVDQGPLRQGTRHVKVDNCPVQRELRLPVTTCKQGGSGTVGVHDEGCITVGRDVHPAGVQGDMPPAQA